MNSQVTSAKSKPASKKRARASAAKPDNTQLPDSGTIVLTSKTSPAESPAKPCEKHWCVYIIETVGGRLYTGITNNLEQRWLAHTSGKGGAKFFHSDAPARIVYSEAADDRSQATRREAAIKRLKRVQKLQLIAEQRPGPL